MQNCQLVAEDALILKHSTSLYPSSKQQNLGTTASEIG